MGFKHWMDIGFKKVGDLFSEDTFMSFQQLVQKYNLLRKHFFKYLQIGSFIYSQITVPFSDIEQYAVQSFTWQEALVHVL